MSLPKYKQFLQTGKTFCNHHGEHNEWYFWATTNSIQCDFCRRAYGKISGVKRRKANGFGLMLTRIKTRAKAEQFDFALTKHDLEALYHQQNGKCALSGVPFDLEMNRASVDRIDSDLGYIPSNIQFTTGWANNMKSDVPEALFIERCRLIGLYE